MAKTVSERQIGMSSPNLSEREIALVQHVMRSNVLSGGPFVERFETTVAAIAGVRHAIAVSSGTAALHECIIAAGIGDGDEVITSSFSFVASANVIAYERARPVLVDIDPATLNLDPALVEAAITPRTRGIMPVHVFGQPADMDAILEISARHDLAVIEDASEAIGAEYKGRPTGSMGDAGVFAFYPNKQVTTAEGGVIVTNSDEFAAVCRSLRNQGRDSQDSWLQHARLGYNYRMSELHAAIGVGQLERFEDLLSGRARVAAAYDERIACIEGVALPASSPTTTRASWFVYVVRLAPATDRTAVMRALEEDGVPTRPYFPPIHLQPHYRSAYGYSEGDLPITEAIASRTLALPFHGQITDDEIDHVCDALRRAVA